MDKYEQPENIIKTVLLKDTSYTHQLDHFWCTEFHYPAVNIMHTNTGYIYTLHFDEHTQRWSHTKKDKHQVTWNLIC